VTAKTSHFSLFALFPAGDLTAQNFRPLEKILTPNGDGINDFAFFSGLSGNFEIRLFDVTGRKVRTIHDAAQWDGRDDDGHVVENGTYIYQFHSDISSDWVSGMIGIAR